MNTNEYRVDWETSSPNPRYVRGSRTHQDIWTSHKSDIFDNLEDAKAFQATLNVQSRIAQRKPGGKIFQPMWETTRMPV
jgi:hypothetical protein